jgi:putative redox protein
MANTIKLSFGEATEGILESANGTTNVSFSGKALAPYELFLGGYASCLHATFMGIMKKRKLDYDKVTYDVTGHKREEVPTTLSQLITNVVVYGANEDKHSQITKSMKQAETYCSISATINNLGTEMILNIEFK